MLTESEPNNALSQEESLELFTAARFLAPGKRLSTASSKRSTSRSRGRRPRQLEPTIQLPGDQRSRVGVADRTFSGQGRSRSELGGIFKKVVPGIGIGAIVALVAGLGYCTWWVWENPGAAFGLLLWTGPIVIMLLGIMALFVSISDEEPAGCVTVPIALLIIWIAYSVACMIWAGASDADKVCPHPLVDLPGGPKLCDVNSNDNYRGPPLFHFE